MRISDWSSDVCSSDFNLEKLRLLRIHAQFVAKRHRIDLESLDAHIGVPDPMVLEISEDRPDLCRRVGEDALSLELDHLSHSFLGPGASRRICQCQSEIGRASCGERVCQSV